MQGIALGRKWRRGCQEKIYQHFCSIWRPLAAKYAICASHPEAYGIRYDAANSAYCDKQEYIAAICAFGTS
jgi:hypothetical protein